MITLRLTSNQLKEIIEMKTKEKHFTPLSHNLLRVRRINLSTIIKDGVKGGYPDEFYFEIFE